MTKTPIITVLIPLYNGIEYLDQCIQSIQNQSYVFWKVLIGINGHGLNSDVYQKAKQYQDFKITVKEYLTKGKPDTMNEMLKDTTTELICVLDVDDWWDTTKLKEQIKIWNTNLWDVIGTQCYYVINEKTKGSPNLPIGYVKDFQKCNPMINSSILMRKKDAHWTNEFFGLDDYDLWLRMFHQGKKFFNLPGKLTYHRVRSNSAFNTKNHEMVDKLKQKFFQNINEDYTKVGKL